MKVKLFKEVEGKMEKKKYQISLPVSLYEEIQDTADKNSTTATNLFRKLIKIGLWLLAESEMENEIIVRNKKGEETQVLIY
jgi:hypothetical protein